MPNFTPGEILSLATQDAGRRADIDASVVSQRANIAYFMVANSVPHALQERIAISSTTSGENRLDLPADFGEPIDISLEWSWNTSASVVSSHKTLTRMSPSQVDAKGFLPVGEPSGIVFFNTWMELWPSPDSAYSLQLRYRSMVTDLVALTDVPSVSTPYRWPIVLKTTELLHNYLGNANGAAMSRNAYIDEMQRVKSDEARRQSGELRASVMPVWPGGRRRVYTSPSYWTHFTP